MSGDLNRVLSHDPLPCTHPTVTRLPAIASTRSTLTNHITTPDINVAPLPLPHHRLSAPDTITMSATLIRPTVRVARAVRSTVQRRHGSHGPTYDQPGGWYLNTPPGTKPVKEGWEGIMYYGFVGSLVAAGIAYAYKPDTS